jgi:hypothetical protein
MDDISTSQATGLDSCKYTRSISRNCLEIAPEPFQGELLAINLTPRPNSEMPQDGHGVTTMQRMLKEKSRHQGGNASQFRSNARLNP